MSTSTRGRNPPPSTWSTILEWARLAGARDSRRLARAMAPSLCRGAPSEAVEHRADRAGQARGKCWAKSPAKLGDQEFEGFGSTCRDGIRPHDAGPHTGAHETSKKGQLKRVADVRPRLHRGTRYPVRE